MARDADVVLQEFVRSLPERAVPYRDRLRGMNATINFDLRDGRIYRAISDDGVISVAEGPGPATTTISARKEHMAGLLDGFLNPMTAYMLGSRRRARDRAGDDGRTRTARQETTPLRPGP